MSSSRWCSCSSELLSGYWLLHLVQTLAGMIAGFNPDRCTDVDGLTRGWARRGSLLAACIYLRRPLPIVFRSPLSP